MSKTCRSAGRTSVLRAGMLLAIPALIAGTACGTDSAEDSGGSSVEAPEGAFADNPATGTPIKIGLINPEGGPAISMPENRQAAEAAAEYANAHLGGIAGHPIEVVSCAAKEDPASNQDCANQMVEQGVSAVVVTTSGNGAAMVPIITGAGIPYLTTSGTSAAELTTPGTYVLSPGFPGALAGMAAYAAEQGYKKVAAYVIDTGTVIASTEAVGKGTFDAAGVELQVAPVTPGTPDSTPQVSAGLADGTEAVAVIGDGTMCTSVLKSLQTLGATQAKMVIQPCLDPAVVDAVGDTLDGSLVFIGADIDSDGPEAVLYRAVMDEYAPDVEIGGFTSTGYAAMLGLIRAAQGVQGEPTAAAVNEAIKTAKDVPMPAADGITFTCDGTAMPMMPTVCSNKMIRATVAEGGQVTSPVVVG
ncbi:ABC transporter substrate-binding protein [Rhodococcus sp. NPDC003382]